MDKVWYNMWVDWRAPGEVPITLNILKTAFIERFFPIEQIYSKVEEFMNLRHGGMLVEEYSLQIVKLSKYASSQCLVAGMRWASLWLVYRRIWRRNVENPCFMITLTFLGWWYIHSRWRWVFRGREAMKARSLCRRIRLVLALVWVHLESKIGPSSRRGTTTKLIPLFQGTVIPKGISAAPRRPMIEMPSVTESCVVSVAVAWRGVHGRF